jgi:hypothetical protein
MNRASGWRLQLAVWKGTDRKTSLASVVGAPDVGQRLIGRLIATHEQYARITSKM